MYDEQQHLDLFNGPGLYLFRGTLPSTSFSASYAGVGVTPTTVDPIVATLFASRYRMNGPAIVLTARKTDFGGLLDGPNLASFYDELAVNLELPPQDFEARSLCTTSITDSLSILVGIGYDLPTRLADHDALNRAIQQSPRMLVEEIDQYVARCQRVLKQT